MRFGRRLGDLEAEELEQQVVIAVPLAAVVEWGDEHIRAFEFDQSRGRALCAGQRVGQRAVHLIDDRRHQHEVALGGPERLQDLLGEVLADETVLPSEARDERGPVLRPADGQVGEVQAGRPALGPFRERDDRTVIEPEGQRPIQEGVAFLGGETEIARPDLDERTTRTAARQREWHCGPRRDRDLQVGWRELDEAQHGLMARLALDGVVVVEDQDHLLVGPHSGR